MADKRMLIVDAEVARKIDENRGDMGRSEFLSTLMDSQLKEETTAVNYVTKEEFQQFEAGMKDLLRTFLEFFLSYGLELGKPPEDRSFRELNLKLQAMSDKAKKS